MLELSHYFGRSIPLVFELVLYLFATTGLIDHPASERPALEPARLLAPDTIGVLSVGRDSALARHWAASVTRLSEAERAELRRHIELAEAVSSEASHDLWSDRTRLARLAKHVERMHVAYLRHNAEQILEEAIVLEMTNIASAVAVFNDPLYVVPIEQDSIETLPPEDGIAVKRFAVSQTWFLARREHVLVCAQTLEDAIGLIRALDEPPDASLAHGERYRAAAAQLAGPCAASLFVDVPNYYRSVRKRLPRSERMFLDQRDAMFGWYDIGAVAGRIRVTDDGPSLELSVSYAPDGEPLAVWLPAGAKADTSLARVLPADTCFATQIQLADPASAVHLADFLRRCDRACVADHHTSLLSHWETQLAGPIIEVAREAAGQVLIGYGTIDCHREQLAATLRRIAPPVAGAPAADEENEGPQAPLVVAVAMRAGADARLEKIAAAWTAAAVANAAGDPAQVARATLARATHAGVEWLAFGDAPRVGGAVVNGAMVLAIPAERMPAILERAAQAAPDAGLAAATTFGAGETRLLRMAYAPSRMIRSFDLADWQNRWRSVELESLSGGANIKAATIDAGQPPALGAVDGALEVERAVGRLRVRARRVGPDTARALLDALRSVEDARRLNACTLLYGVYHDGQKFEANRGHWPVSIQELERWGSEQDDYYGYATDRLIVHGTDPSGRGVIGRMFTAAAPRLAAARRVLAYTRAETLVGGRVVLTADGQIRFLDDTAFARFARPNAIGADPPVPTEDE